MYDDKKLLLIMRHAKSDRTIADLIDFDRPLNQRGENEPKVIAKGLNKLDIAIEKAIVSSSRRTVDTWCLLEKKLDTVPDVIFDKRLYNAYYQDALEVVMEEAADCQSLLMIGHNPSVTEISEYLSGEFNDMKPATCIIFSSLDDSLKKSLKKPGRFKIEKIITAQ